MMARGFGYYCKTEDNEFIYQIVREAGKPIKKPLFFMEDPCLEKVNDILEYFSMLVKYNHEVTELDFERIYLIYYNSEGIVDINYQDKSGKSLLMYACELNYLKIAAELINNTANLNLSDSSGMTALMYACEANNIKLITLLLTNGTEVRKRDTSYATAMDYCISDSAIKLVEHVYLLQEKEFGRPFLIFKRGSVLKKINTDRQKYFDFFTDITGDTLEYGIRKITGSIEWVSPDSICLASQEDNIKKSYGGLSQEIKLNSNYYGCFMRTFDKSGLVQINYKSRKSETFTNMGYAFLSIGILTSLVVAPLISINYSNGDFNKNLYYTCSLSGLCVVTISLPMLIFSRVKKIELPRQYHDKSESWEFSDKSYW